MIELRWLNTSGYPTSQDKQVQGVINSSMVLQFRQEMVTKEGTKFTEWQDVPVTDGVK